MFKLKLFENLKQILNDFKYDYGSESAFFCPKYFMKFVWRKSLLFWYYKTIRCVYFHDCWCLRIVIYSDSLVKCTQGDWVKDRLQKTVLIGFRPLQRGAAAPKPAGSSSFSSSSRSQLEQFQFILTATKVSHIVGLSLIVFNNCWYSTH